MRTTLLALVLFVLPAGSALAQDTAAERATAAQRVYETSLAELPGGRSSEEDVYRWSYRWMIATIELGTPGPATQAHLDRMIALRESVRALTASGMLTTRAGLACDYYVAEARAFRVRPPAR
jgi:hypothetical protein